MATVGNLFINVKARTASFRKKMSGVSKTVKKLALGFGKIAKKVALFGAALGALALVAIVALTKKGLAAVDSITKLARSLGTTTEAISAMQHAAVIGGVDIEKMDKAVGKMFKNVGEAKMLGTGDAIEVFRSLGLDIDAIAGMQADEMFGTIADSINKLGTAGERAAAANKIFGRTGVDLLNVIKDGSQGMADMRKEAEMLGLTFTDKMGNQVEQANDAWARIGAIWRGLSNQLAVHFAPILIEIANRIRDFVVDAGGMGQVAEWIVTAFFNVGAAVLDVVRTMKIGWFGFKAAVLQVFADVVLIVAGAIHSIQVLYRDLMVASLQAAGFVGKSFKWMGKKAAGWAEDLEADAIASWLNTAANVSGNLGTIFTAMGNVEWDTTAKSDFVKTMEDLGISVGEQAADSAQDLLNELAKGWHIDKVPDFIKNLKETFAGEGFEFTSGGPLELQTPDMRGAVDSLQTAIGSFKVEGDHQARVLDRTLKVDEQHLSTSKQILAAIRTDGSGALT